MKNTHTQRHFRHVASVRNGACPGCGRLTGILSQKAVTMACILAYLAVMAGVMFRFIRAPTGKKSRLQSFRSGIPA